MRAATRRASKRARRGRERGTRKLRQEGCGASSALRSAPQHFTLERPPPAPLRIRHHRVRSSGRNVKPLEIAKLFLFFESILWPSHVNGQANAVFLINHCSIIVLPFRPEHLGSDRCSAPRTEYAPTHRFVTEERPRVAPARMPPRRHPGTQFAGNRAGPSESCHPGLHPDCPARSFALGGRADRKCPLFDLSSRSRRAPRGDQGLGTPSYSINSTPSGTSNSKVLAGGDRLIARSENAIRVTLPKRSVTDVSSTSPVPGSATSPRRS